MRKLIRSLMNKVGYDFIKVNVHSADKAKKTVPVQVAGFNILMPGSNPQISLYKYYPTSNSQLARLARLVQNKYPDSTMADIGANVGDTIAVIRSQSDIPVIAIEGDAFSYSFLQKNVGQFKDVVILQQFLGEEKKELTVNIEKDGWNNTLIPNESGTRKLKIITFDNLIAEKNLSNRNLKLIKVDTEGFDTIILRGCKETISKHNPVIYFEYNGENMKAIGEDGISTLLSFKSKGYEFIHIYDCINNLILVTKLDDTETIRQLHEYTRKDKSMIPYFDICLFHKDDVNLSDAFYQSEK
ncbi:MAG: FkbM family methyltransferase [Bacteroidetes bacterium]|nr:FkbM family methyltransferase [Bacteroidota bacterium]